MESFAKFGFIRRQFVDGEDDRGLGCGFFELVGQFQGLLQLGPDFHAGADLLVEGLVAFRAAQGLELARQLLASGRCRGVTRIRRKGAMASCSRWSGIFGGYYRDTASGGYAASSGSAGRR